MDSDDEGLLSMTGYGCATANLRGWGLRVECRSVNHKRLNTRVHTPEELRWIEPTVTTRLRDELKRGAVDVRIEVEPGVDKEEPKFAQIDEERFSAVTEKLKRLADDSGLATSVSLQSVWEYREFFDRSTGEVFSADNPEPIVEVFDEAVQQLVASRRTEGRGLRRDLSEYLDQLSAHLEYVQALRRDGEQARRSRVESRLREAVDQFELDEIDDARLRQEVAYYVEKGDISEEIQRAVAHTEKLGDVITDGSGAMGKKIDFYLQELIRETNTMGSKSQHPELTERVIDMKALIEKMREQAANVE